jgi:hypothetical protein
MTDEVQARRGEAAWKEQRDAISQRNADVRKRAQAGQKSRESAAENRIREHERREQEQLRALNARIGERRVRRSR